MTLEMKIIEWFQFHRSGALDALMAVLSFLSEGHVTILTAGAIAGYWLYLRRKKEAFLLFGGTALGAALELVLKSLFGRERPPLPHQIPGYSFPSGHVLCSTVFIGLLVLMGFHMHPRRKVLYSFLAFAALVAIGIDRVYLGVHWPSDVVAGYIMGLVVVGLWPAVVGRLWDRSETDSPVPPKNQTNTRTSPPPQGREIKMTLTSLS